jgi:dGTPase
MSAVSVSEIKHTAPQLAIATYAAQDAFSKGREYPEVRAEHRGEFQRDRERIIHSTAFRRLEYKTQVFVNHEGDLFRTRLTHSIEVAQIARAVARALNLNQDLCEAIALAHDLGHTPFGHAGQNALNICMREYGGFEHNLQSLRVVDKLELKYPQFPGLNLTFETREGILKHCSHKNAEKLGLLGQRFLLNSQPSLEAQLTNIADEIAYNNHDIDDGLRAGLITVEQLCGTKSFCEHFTKTTREYPGISERRKVYETIRRIINDSVTDLINTSQAAIIQKQASTIDSIRVAEKPLIQFSEAMQVKNRELKSFLHKNLYQHYRVHRMSKKSKRILSDLYTAFFDDACLMPDEYHDLAKLSQQQKGDSGRARVVSDYIAGMTDRYAIAEHERIFNARVV